MKDEGIEEKKKKKERKGKRVEEVYRGNFQLLSIAAAISCVIINHHYTPHHHPRYDQGFTNGLDRIKHVTQRRRGFLTNITCMYARYPNYHQYHKPLSLRLNDITNEPSPSGRRLYMKHVRMHVWIYDTPANPLASGKANRWLFYEAMDIPSLQ